jgi:hypothetical protein
MVEKSEHEYARDFARIKKESAEYRKSIEGRDLFIQNGKNLYFLCSSIISNFKI